MDAGRCVPRQRRQRRGDAFTGSAEETHLLYQQVWGGGGGWQPQQATAARVAARVAAWTPAEEKQRGYQRGGGLREGERSKRRARTTQYCDAICAAASRLVSAATPHLCHDPCRRHRPPHACSTHAATFSLPHPFDPSLSARPCAAEPSAAVTSPTHYAASCHHLRSPWECRSPCSSRMAMRVRRTSTLPPLALPRRRHPSSGARVEKRTESAHRRAQHRSLPTQLPSRRLRLSASRV